MITDVANMPLADLLSIRELLAGEAGPGAQRLSLLPVGRPLLGLSDQMFRGLELIGRCPEKALSGAARFRVSHELRQFVAAACEYQTRPGQTAIVRFAVQRLGGPFGCAAPTRGAVRFPLSLE